VKVKVCAVGDVPPDGMACFDVSGKRVLIANVQDQFYAIGDTCTHAESSLAEGYLDVEAGTVECAMHNAVFSLANGEALEFPAEEPVPSFPVIVEDESIYIEMND